MQDRRRGWEKGRMDREKERQEAREGTPREERERERVRGEETCQKDRCSSMDAALTEPSELKDSMTL